MRFKFSIITFLLAALLIGGASAHAQKSKGQGKGQGTGRGEGVGRGEGAGRGEDSEQDEDQKQDKEKQSEVTVAATDTVNVTLSTGGGKISVRGWDRREVHAQAKESGAKIETRA